MENDIPKLRDILGNLSKERYQKCCSVQQVKLRRGLKGRGAVLQAEVKSAG